MCYVHLIKLLLIQIQICEVHRKDSIYNLEHITAIINCSAKQYQGSPIKRLLYLWEGLPTYWLLQREKLASLQVEVAVQQKNDSQMEI